MHSVKMDMVVLCTVCLATRPVLLNTLFCWIEVLLYGTYPTPRKKYTTRRTQRPLHCELHVEGGAVCKSLELVIVCTVIVQKSIAHVVIL